MKVVAAQETENRWIDLNYALRSAAFRMRAALLLSLLGKAGFRPDQPRVPAGVPEGGQWVDEGGDGDLIFVNDDPNRLPEIPKEPPPSTRERNRIGGAVARYLLATSLAAHADAVRHWVWEYARDRIIAYLDEPKFLDALQRAAIDPRPGYEIHHIVEQTPAQPKGFRSSEWTGGGTWCASRHIDIGKSRAGMGGAMNFMAG
jgi:hypothetical protein